MDENPGEKMKLLFFFNWEFSNLCHALAIELNKRYPKKFEYCGFVVEKKDYVFLKNQNDVKYGYLGLVPDAYAGYKSETVDKDYLTELEREYGMPTLWPYIYADRNLVIYNIKNYTHEDYLKLTQAYFRYITDMLQKTRPEWVIIDVVASMPAYVLFAVARKLGIKTFLYNSARTMDLVTVAANPEENLEHTFSRYDELGTSNSFGTRRQDAVDFLKSFREQGAKPEYVTTSNKAVTQYFSPAAQILKIPRIAEYFFNYHFGHYRNDPAFEGKPLSKVMIEKIKQRYRKVYLDHADIFQKPDYTEDYVFFPLHYEPETATMIMSPMYIDQIPVIENISKSLPIAYKLYVKDHPVMAALGKREFSYYKKLMNIPNIKLIDPRVDSHALIKNCRLLITITGTAGWEAVLLKKPVITFGNVFYNKLGMVRKCKGYPELPYLVKDTLDAYKHDEDELIRFLSALFETSFSAKFYEMNGQAYQVSVDFILKHRDFPVVVDFFLKVTGVTG